MTEKDRLTARGELAELHDRQKDVMNEIIALTEAVRRKIPEINEGSISKIATMDTAGAIGLVKRLGELKAEQTEIIKKISILKETWGFK